MNVLSQSGTSDYQNRTVTIEVAGARQQSVMKQSSYRIRVPYSQMSQTMQAIHRRGDRIASVAVVEAAGGVAEEIPSASSSRASASDASPQSGQGAESKAPKGQDPKKTQNKRR